MNYAHVKMGKLFRNGIGSVVTSTWGVQGHGPPEASSNEVDFDFCRIYRSQIMKCFKNLPRLQ